MADKLITLVSVLLTVSGSPSIRAYEKPENIDDNLIIYKLISNVSNRSHSGSMISKARIQLDIYGTTLASSRTLTEAVKNKLDLNRIDFVLSWLENEFTVVDLESGLFRTIMDFYVF